MHGALPGNRTKKKSKQGFMGFLRRVVGPNCNTIRSFSVWQRLLKMTKSKYVWGIGLFLCFALVLIFLLLGPDNFSPLEGRSPVTDQFNELAIDDRVLFKSGMEEAALLVQRVLDNKIREIEEVHGKPFTKKVIVHICDTQDCFNSYTGLKGGILAAVTSNGLFLSPYVISNEDYAIWLAHELSHLHLFQQISIFKAGFIPQWYHDGLATYASNGGGATRISRKEALKYILDGKHIVASDKGAFFGTRWPLNYVVSSDTWPQPWYQQHMDYRQASLFYEFLHPKGGSELLRALEKGESFSQAFISTYGKTPAEMFSIYKNSLHPNKVDENI